MSIGSIMGGSFDYAAMRSHMQSQAQSKLESADTDGNGGVSLEEFKAASAQGADGAAFQDKMFAKLDGNGDGEITSGELPGASSSGQVGGPFGGGPFGPGGLSGGSPFGAGMFQTLMGGGGSFGGNPFQAMMGGGSPFGASPFQAMMGGGFGAGSAGSAVDMAGMQAEIQAKAQDKFATADADGSGGVSLEEFTTAKAEAPEGLAKPAGAPADEEIFAALDGDGDGEVTESELMAMKETAKSSGPGGLMELLNGSVQQQPSGEEDLVGELLDTLTEDGEDDEEDDAA